MLEASVRMSAASIPVLRTNLSIARP
jgi:hypothetical protein